MKRGSTVGRRRKLTDEQVAGVLRWHVAIQALMVLHAHIKPMRKFASEMGVTKATVSDVIR